MRTLACLVALFVTSSASAGEIGHAYLGNEVAPLGGAIPFCEAIPSRCEPHTDAIVILAPELTAEMHAVNDEVNKEITFEAEPEGSDVWQDRNFTHGDCEDYALTKKKRLIEKGWPAGALRLGVVLKAQKDREQHAILLVSTDKGEYVLDVPGEKLRLFDPKEFYELERIWAANGKWYSLKATPPSATVGMGH